MQIFHTLLRNKNSSYMAFTVNLFFKRCACAQLYETRMNPYENMAEI